MSNNRSFAFALEYVSDIPAAKRFYVDVLGLEVDREAPNFVQFKDQAGAFFAVTSDEAMGERNELELYWLVDDIEAAQREMGKKTAISMPIKEMPFGKVFGVTDPAGRTRYLLQWATQRPSRQA